MKLIFELLRADQYEAAREHMFTFHGTMREELWFRLRDAVEALIWQRILAKMPTKQAEHYRKTLNRFGGIS